MEQVLRRLLAELREAERERELAEERVRRIQGLVRAELQRSRRFERVPGSLQGRIRDLMLDNRMRSTKDVALTLGADRAAVGDAMKRMAQLGDDSVRRTGQLGEDRLRRVRRGVYRRRPYWDE